MSSPLLPVTPPVMDTQAGCTAGLLWGLHTAMAQGARRITCVWPSGAAWPGGSACSLWPFEDPTVLGALGGWLRQPQRELVLLAEGFDAVPQLLPRFTAWRCHWAHALQAWRAPEELAADLPAALFDDKALSVQVISPERWRGRASTAVRDRILVAQGIDVVLQRSERAFAVNTLWL
jgi:hypothetical protein